MAAEPGPAGRLPRTAAALRRLDGLLRCSRCPDLVTQAVSLGCCEHVCCRACVGGCAGVECPVCHIPIMVRDIKVNRPLDNIARLYRKLQKKLQDEDFPASGSVPSSPWEEVADRGKKRQIKMWFSPRSRKMRFQHLKERPEEPEDAVAEQGIRPPAPSTSAYDFHSPSREPVKEGGIPLKCKKKLRRLT